MLMPLVIKEQHWKIVLVSYMELCAPFLDRMQTRELYTMDINGFMRLNLSLLQLIPNGLIGYLYGPVGRYML